MLTYRYVLHTSLAKIILCMRTDTALGVLSQAAKKCPYQLSHRIESKCTGRSTMIAFGLLLFLLLEPTIALPDWLVTEVKIPAELKKYADGRVLKLTNGIVTRTFLTDPGFVTIDLYSHEKNSSVLRALDPEVTIHCTHLSLLLHPGLFRRPRSL